MNKKQKTLFFRIFSLFLICFSCFFAFFGCSNIFSSQETVNITISDDGYWVIGGKKTTTKAEAENNTITLKDAYNELVAEGYSGTFSDFVKEYFSSSIDITASISQECKNCVVAISRKNSTKTGSGVIFEMDNDGNAYILTNYHVTYPNAETEEFKLYLASDEEKENVIAATFVTGNEYVDLAILKVENSQTILNAGVAEIATSNASDGTTCLAIGNTHSKGISITFGTVSKSTDTCSYSAGALGSITRTVLRHCAYIEKGSSGGGLFNLAGELIGITNAGESGETTLMNYAVQVETIRSYLNENFYNA